MKSERNEQWRELAWRQLEPAERERLRAWLTAHPEAREEWALERALTGALRRLPDAPVPSNFTSLVVQAVARPAAQGDRPAPGWFAWSRRPRWLPRIGFAALLLMATLLSYRHQVLATQRAAIARSVVTVSGVAAQPSPKILKDFEAIRALNETGPDLDLLRLLP